MDAIVAYRWVTADGLHNHVGAENLDEFLFQTETPREVLIPMTWRDFTRESLDYRNEIARLRKLLRFVRDCDTGTGKRVCAECQGKITEALGETVHNALAQGREHSERPTGAEG